MPGPDEQIQEELVDVRRDLQNVAAGRDPQAPENLAEDLRKYTDRPNAELTVDEIVATYRHRAWRRRSVGTGSTEAGAQSLALGGRPRTERTTVETLQNDVQSLLMEEGVAEENAEQVAAQVGDVQGAVTRRPRRWYELF